MSQVPLGAIVTFMTWTTHGPAPVIVTGESPQVALVPPGLKPFVSGADQPAGTVRSSSPPMTPPAAAVYVKVKKFPLELLIATVGVTVTVPAPSAATTFTCGEVASACRLLSFVDSCCVVNVETPPVEGAVAPGPPEPVSP